MNKHKRKIELITLIIFILLFAIIVGLNSIRYSNFFPINGDFQNYNPVRRLLSGQTPYRDFAVYLGLGHLYLISFFTLIIGNNFTTSMFVSNMLTMLCFELLVFTISYLVLKDKKKSSYICLYVTLICSCINFIRPVIVKNILNSEFLNALDFSIDPGNSARLIRNIVPIIFVLIVIAGFRFLEKTKIKLIAKNLDISKKIYIAIFAGLCILWSNDGGIATYIAISFIYFILLIKQYKKDIKKIILYTLMYIGISLLSVIFVLLIVTKGHLLSWFNYTFGVSSYQSWYYGSAPYKRNITLGSIDLSLNNIIMILITVFYIYRIFKSRKYNDILKYSLLSIIVLSSIISAYLYQFLSGGISRNMLNIVLLILGLCYIIKYLYQIIYKKINFKIIKDALILLSCAVLISSGTNSILNMRNRGEATYIDSLKGYFTTLGDSINYATDRIGNKKIFSTYASAIEVATSQFQPTGYDYIIHCLGDKNREDYLQKFNEGDFEYVTTTDRDYIGYRYWIRNANWFFYRQLYRDYVPVFATEYNVFWQKQEIDDVPINAELNIEKTSDTNYLVTTDNSNFDGIASISLKYKSNFIKNFFTSRDLNRYVYVDDITGKRLDVTDNTNYNIPSSSDLYYIPITIIDGKGQINISSYPTDNTVLEIYDAQIDKVFNTNFKYGVLSNHDIEGNTLYIDNTLENEIIFKDVKKIKIDSTISTVINYSSNDDYIMLEVDENANAFAYPNFFEVIKEE